MNDNLTRTAERDDSAAQGLATALKCALAVGISDFFFASITSWFLLHRTPVRVFQGVASVPFGKGALNAGMAGALVGLGIHFTVAMFWSSMYLLLTRGIPALRNLVRTPGGAFAFACVYGPLIWMTMSLALIPSMVHAPAKLSLSWWVQLLGHIPFIVGPMIWVAGDGRGK